MFSCCQLAIYNTFRASALICHFQIYPRITNDFFSHQTKIIELKTTIDQRNHVFICDSPQKNYTIKKQKDQGFSKGELQRSEHLMEYQILESATVNELHVCT